MAGIKQRLPDAMLRYMTAELAEALAILSQPQIDAIYRIIAVGHLAEDPLAPWRLFEGGDQICSKTTWFKRGLADPATGRWLPGHRPGWAHQKAFVDALQLAKRLARQAQASETMQWVTDARRLAQRSAPAVMQNLVSLATARSVINGAVVERDVADRDQIAASKVLLDHAMHDEAATPGVNESAANDWWAAAEAMD